MAARVLISLEEISVKFGGKPLFEDLSIHITENDKICLVGKNGAGKTTLMRLITGDLDPDSGKRFVYPGLSIGYVSQTTSFEPGETVRQYVIGGLKKEERTEDRYHLADIVIGPLALEPDARMDILSGGQLRRATLARSLVCEPDLLLLDEPTNHLDLSGIEWLEQYLAAYRGAVLCISHDRTFLRNISRKVFWIDRGAIRTSPGGYDQFEEWSEQLIEQEARELHNLQKKLEAEIDWTQGGVSGRRKRNVRRLNELNRLREKLKKDKAAYNLRMKAIEMDPLATTQSSKIIAEFKSVTKSFTRDGRDIPILKDFNLRIVRGDRIGILGKNGSGKSTFIKLLMGELEPDKGRVFRGKTIDISYFDQARSMLNPKKSLWDTLCPEGGDYVYFGSEDNRRYVHVCGYLKNFLFDPRIARDLVGTLSGGQQNRLMLAKVLAHPGNVLILDEPTNDLDMDTLDMLQEILSEYDGTLIVVSHDRDFLDRTVTEVLAFEGNAIVEGYMGGYSDYLEAREKKEKSVTESSAPKKFVAEQREGRPSNKMSFKLVHELEKLPGRMEALEKEIAELSELLADPQLYTREPEKFDQSSRRLTRAQNELEQAELRWLELEEIRQATF